MSTDSGSQDFETTKYGLDRQQEVALNQFTHALEMEQIKLLIFLNGGAAALLVTFAEKSSAQTEWNYFVAAIGCWLAGVILGALATFEIRDAQSKYGQAYNNRRRAIEWRKYKDATKDDAADFTARLRPPSSRRKTIWDRLFQNSWWNTGSAAAPPKAKGSTSNSTDPTPAGSPPQVTDGDLSYDQASNSIFEDAGSVNKRVEYWSVFSLLLFAAGAAAAAAMVLSAASNDRPPEKTTITVSFDRG